MKTTSVLLILLLSPACRCFAQYLSHLSAGKSDPLYTTYAAPPERSDYKTDQGYEFLWNDPERGPDFRSADGGTLGFAFAKGGEWRYSLGSYYREPLVTASYSDLVRFESYPFRDILVEAFFCVYSSTAVLLDLTITNLGPNNADIRVYPLFFLPSGKTGETTFDRDAGVFSFRFSKKKDGWMNAHDIPLATRFRSVFSMVPAAESWGGFRDFTGGKEASGPALPDSVSRAGLTTLVLQKSLVIPAGKSASLRIMRASEAVGTDGPKPAVLPAALVKADPGSLIREDEKTYASVPPCPLKDREAEALYWSAFSLMRQCMMPREGKCRRNYYVFSREPKWGWGYGGQVFHESLAMLAYALMDPAGAMNSQRVYMDRQAKDGYISYRTGPYLDETIETNGMPTCAAPWFCYENYEIFKITQDREFLGEAYASGKRLYEYFVRNRDGDRDGLCEWGGEAVLESVRDARVAVWDRVGDPAAFEGPDLNSMLVMEAKALAEMAQELGLREEAARWRSDARKRSDLINKYMWDPLTGFYYNIDKTGHTFTYKSKNDLKIKEIIGFLPLWAGIADKEKASGLLHALTDTAEFWRPFGVPTLTARDSYYNPIGYWNGPVWVQWNYLVFRGLLDYGYKAEASALASKVMKQMAYHLGNDHTFWEFYSPDDLQAGWNRTYIWAGIIARYLMDLGKQQEKLRPFYDEGSNGALNSGSLK